MFRYNMNTISLELFDFFVLPMQSVLFTQWYVFVGAVSQCIILTKINGSGAFLLQ